MSLEHYGVISYDIKSLSAGFFLVSELIIDQGTDRYRRADLVTGAWREEKEPGAPQAGQRKGKEKKIGEKGAWREEKESDAPQAGQRNGPVSRFSTK